jgi:sensor domain CHASE-containing protein
MNAIIVAIIVLAVLNLILLLLYIDARNKSQVVVYDDDTKTRLKTRVIHIREELEGEMNEDTSWLEGAVEEELKHL